MTTFNQPRIRSTPPRASTTTHQSAGDLVLISNFFLFLKSQKNLFFFSEVNRSNMPSSNSIQIVHRAESKTASLPSTSSQPVLLPSNPLLRYFFETLFFTDTFIKSWTFARVRRKLEQYGTEPFVGRFCRGTGPGTSRRKTGTRGRFPRGSQTTATSKLTY